MANEPVIIYYSVPVGLSSPVARLKYTFEQTERMKKSPLFLFLMGWGMLKKMARAKGLKFLAGAMYASPNYMPHAHRALILTNVPGPQYQLLLMKIPVLRYVGVCTNSNMVTCMTSNNFMNICWDVDPLQVDEPAILKKLMAAELDKQLVAAGGKASNGKTNGKTNGKAKKA